MWSSNGPETTFNLSVFPFPLSFGFTTTLKILDEKNDRKLPTKLAEAITDSLPFPKIKSFSSSKLFRREIKFSHVVVNKLAPTKQATNPAL